MTFDSSGYDLVFVQRANCKDNSAHLATYVYKFYSPKTQLYYIVNAELHEHDVFAVKFYCKRDKRNKNKYCRIINKGDVSNILITCIKVIPFLLNENPKASFCFIGSPTISTLTNQFEPIRITQRFRIYRELVQRLIGEVTFTHYEYIDVSGYLLLNNCHDEIKTKQLEIITMFRNTYNEVPNGIYDFQSPTNRTPL